AGTLYALDATTGAVKWTADAGHAVSSPTVAGDRVYVIGYGELHAFDAQTGALVWSAGPINLGVNSPTVANGRVFVADEGGIVTAVDQLSGVILLQRANGHGFQFSTPAVDGIQLFVVTA